MKINAGTPDEMYIDDFAMALTEIIAKPSGGDKEE